MQQKIKETEFFNRRAEIDEYDVLTPRGYSAIIRRFLEFIKDREPANCRVIDLGCGTGVFTRRFSSHIDGEFFGLDISLRSMELARQKDKGATYLVGDIEHLNFKSEVFDVVIFSGVLHHFINISQCLKEGYRVLKKGGCILSYDPNVANPFMWLYRQHNSPFFSRLGRTDNERLISASEMELALRQAGFVKTNIRCISGVTFRYVESRVARLLLPLYNLFEMCFGLLPIARSYGSFVVCYGEKA